MPDGATVSLATTFGSVLTVTGITNANPAVASSTAHGLANGSFITLKSGWQRLNDRTFRVSNVAANTFQLEGVDTTDTTAYPAAGGAGTAIQAITFVQIPQVVSFDVTGGEPQYQDVSFLEDNFTRQLFTVFSASSINMVIAFDPTTPGYQALLTASRARAIRPLQLALPNGARLMFNGQINLSETPTVAKGQIMQTRIGVNLNGLPVIYTT